jgi:hypothetical protein
VTENVGVVALPKIQDAVAVLVDNPAAGSRSDPGRKGAYQAEGVAAAVHERRFGPLVQGGGAGRTAGELIFQL